MVCRYAVKHVYMIILCSTRPLYGDRISLRLTCPSRRTLKIPEVSFRGEWRDAFCRFLSLMSFDNNAKGRRENNKFQIVSNRRKVVKRGQPRFALWRTLASELLYFDQMIYDQRYIFYLSCDWLPPKSTYHPISFYSEFQKNLFSFINFTKNYKIISV